MTSSIAQDCANVSTALMSRKREKKTESAISGKNNRAAVPEMVTQSLPESKNLITQNTQEATESLDSAASCVGAIERKTQRVGIRLTLTERKALEIAAQQKRLTLSDYILRLIPKNIAA